ncbi:MAG TPA: glutamate--tRNA ligase [Thermoplasmata archaeon]|nr:glutamate--tRNA ligase [Thermoplasmata archaeon]
MLVAPDDLSAIRRLALENAIDHGGAVRSGSVLSRALGSIPSLRSRGAEAAEAIRRIADEVNRLGPDAQRRELASLGGPLPLPGVPRSAEPTDLFPELPRTDDRPVVLRMAPFPSGALHIGNARMIYVNDYYRKRYGGRLLLVFDDTVGSKEKRIAPELYDVIRHDLTLAGVEPDEVFYKSDRLSIVYDWARRVIERGGAYVCRCPAELLQANRSSGTACRERAQSEGETLDLFRKMLDGGFQVGEAVLRLRTDLADPDPAFRDRVLLRLSDLDHPRVGRRWKVWPMLEFSWAVDDVELGVSHVIRGKDLVIEDRMETFLWKLLGIEGPPFVHWGLLRVAEAKISKSKGFAQIASGEYDGWADPRLWSIDSLDRRGISAAALRKFTLSFGLSLADIDVPAETLYAENRQVIDATTSRRSFVADPVLVEIQGFPEGLGDVELANHPDRPELGTRAVATGPRVWLAAADVDRHLGEELRLKDLLNLRLPSAREGPSPIAAEFTSRENRRLPRLQWVGESGAVAVDLLDLDGSHRRGVAERTLREARPRDLYQFERVGFVRVESDWSPGTEPVRVCFGHP